MSKNLDVLVLGATGFTGKFVAKYIRQFIPDLRWGIAGRDQSKLETFSSELMKISSNPSNQQPPDIVIADAHDRASLVRAFKGSKIVINCTGPYRFLGESVVDACIDAEADYMDISGEPQFMETSFLKFHAKAEERNVLILHSCAFDSVPADLGVLNAMRHFAPDCCAKVDSFIDIKAKLGFQAHVTTYDCAVHGFGDADLLREVRKNISTQFKIPKIDYIGAKLPKRDTGDYFEHRINSNVVPFMGADVSVVRSSQRSLAMLTGQRSWPLYSHYAAVSNLQSAVRYRNLFVSLAQHKWGRELLLRFPTMFSGGIFTTDGPSQEQVNNTTFDFHLFADGYSTPEKKISSLGAKPVELPDVSHHFVMSGPEPFYQCTPRLLMPLAITLLEDRHQMPKGGVLTPAAAYYNTPQVFSRLAQAGMEFKKLT